MPIFARYRRSIARIGLVLFSIVAGFLLTACSSTVLLDEVSTSAPNYAPTTTEQPLAISYRLGSDAVVDIYLLNADGAMFYLRESQPRTASADAYVLRFDGTVPTEDPVLLRQLLPPGEYTLVVAATTPSGERDERNLPLVIAGERPPSPDVEHLVIVPQTISPNADAIDDVAEITYRLPVSATIDINVTAPTGEIIPVVTREEEGPYEQHHVWNGKRTDGSLLPSGVYTYTVRAEDSYGNIVQRQGNLSLENVGQPEARIVYASIAPQRVMLGDTITVTMRVKNTGTVPIRTYGPGSGYTYTTNEVFSSIEDGQYTSQAGGFWRIGVDWDANSGGGRRYPFRWALSQRPPEEWTVPGVEDWLMPGEEVEVTGQITVLQRETKMGFYVGLIQDGVGFFQDRSAYTIVEVGF